MHPIRNAAKAVIMREGQLLVIVKQDPQGEWCLLPGGGQEAGEALHQTLQRECREELGTEVTVGELLCVRDYIGKNHEFADAQAEVHQVEFMFECHVPHDYQAHSGELPDQGQLAVRWVPLDRLSRARLYPAALAHWLAAGQRLPRYLGDVN